jgi:hypothetical protein
MLINLGSIRKRKKVSGRAPKKPLEVTTESNPDYFKGKKQFKNNLFIPYFSFVVHFDIITNHLRRCNFKNQQFIWIFKDFLSFCSFS